MSKSLKQWVEQDAKPMKKLMGQHPEQFFRDPARPQILDDSYFFTPADGVVLYAQQCVKKDDLFDIKGKKLTVDEIAGCKIDLPVIIAGIFMTAEDVHINRIPYSGFLKWKNIDCLKTTNRPMLHEELDLLKGLIKYDDMEYIFCNEQMINQIFIPKLGFKYWVIQIADFDVDTITPFETGQNIPVKQNQRFSMIRYGSQLDLIVPIIEGFEYKIVCKPFFHVEAGIDQLIKISKKENFQQWSKRNN